MQQSDQLQNTRRCEKNAFRNCISLRHLTIPHSVTEISENAFDGCGQIEFTAPLPPEDHISEEIKHQINELREEGFIIQPCRKRLQLSRYKGEKEQITIPPIVTRIADKAFAWNTTVKKIIIPDTVTEIGKQAFDGCSALESVVLSDRITVISESAFSHCRSLTGIVLPDSVTEIESSAFEFCTELKNVTLSKSLIYIRYDAFMGCRQLRQIEIPVSVKRIDSGAFKSCTSLTNVSLPYGVQITRTHTSRQIISSSTMMEPPYEAEVQIPGSFADTPFGKRTGSE